MNELIDELLADAGERMNKSVESTRNELATVRTGRASPHLLDRIIVDYYGTETPLNQLSNVATSDARLLTVTPYDKSSLSAIEKAIMESDIGLTPNNDGNIIRPEDKANYAALLAEFRTQLDAYGAQVIPTVNA